MLLLSAWCCEGGAGELHKAGEDIFIIATRMLVHLPARYLCRNWRLSAPTPQAPVSFNEDGSHAPVMQSILAAACGEERDDDKLSVCLFKLSFALDAVLATLSAPLVEAEAAGALAICCCRCSWCT